METEYFELFASMITEPLSNVVGRSIQSVIYYPLYHDMSSFDVGDPNGSGGCQGIRLIFDYGEVELDWNWDAAFRSSSAIAFHLGASSSSYRQACVRQNDEENEAWCGLAAIDATAAIPWKSVHGEMLRGVTVWGFLLPNALYSPQAVTFLFDSSTIAITIGYTSDMEFIGDGDEVLVFTEREWTRRVAQQTRCEFVPFWQYPAKYDYLMRKHDVLPQMR